MCDNLYSQTCGINVLYSAKSTLTGVRVLFLSTLLVILTCSDKRFKHRNWVDGTYCTGTLLLKMYAIYQIHGLPNIQEADESGTSSSSVASVKWLPILTQSNVLIPSQFFRWVHGCSTSRLVWWWSSPRIRAGESFSEFLKDDLMIVLYVCQLSCRNHMWALNDSVGE